VPGQVSPANLVLHLTGNLRHFFGHLLDGSDYVRNREREFQDEPYASREAILLGWDTACRETAEVLKGLDEARLASPAPLEPFPGGAPVHTMVLRLLAHLTYHAGQIRSMRRLIVPSSLD
jgi:hypothetical protein